jgi:NitT/TauT family transport system substrate-binding protein
MLDHIIRSCLAGAFAVTVASPCVAQTPDKVSFGTNWVAQAEHGGFYQALADGTYKKYGLDVTIVPGGPNVNNRILLPVGKIDFFMSANSLQSFDAVEQNVPTIAVAAIFQKDPQVFLVHPGQGIATFEDLKKLTLLVSKEGIGTYFQWMKKDFGFDEKKVKPYTFNPQPFLADKSVAMQGYVTSEPYAIEQAAKFKPVVFLLADQGFNTYSTLMIRKYNPEMTDALLAYSVATMKQYGIVDSGDTQKSGIGAMSDSRMKDFFDKMVRAGVVKSSIDYKKSYTLRFVNKSVGLDLRPKR